MRLTEEEKNLLQQLRDNGATNQDFIQLTQLVNFIISKRKGTC